MNDIDIMRISHRHNHERRREKRRIQRLNWGKTLSISEVFISECVITNLTVKGAGLHIARQVNIPRYFLLYVDLSSVVFEAELIWRNGAALGCKLAEPHHSARSAVVRRMQTRYYGL